MRRQLLFLLIITVTGTVYSQKEWTLQDCINYALENNIRVKREKLKTVAHEKDYTQSKFQLLPDLNAGFDHQFSSGRGLNTEEYKWENRKLQEGSLGLRSNVTLFNGLQNYNQIKVDHYNLMSSMAELDVVKNNITLNIALSYLQILLDEELLEVSKSQLEVTSLQVERTKKLVEVGNVAQGELLKIKAQEATERLNIVNARNQLNISVLNLTQLLDLDSVGDFAINHPKDLEVRNYELQEIDNIYQEALKNLPQVKSAEYIVKSAEKSLSVAKGSRSPELYLQGLYYSRYNKDYIDITDPEAGEVPYGEQILDNQYKRLTVGLSVPIFNRYHIQTNIGKAEVNLEDARFNFEQTKQILYKEIQQAHADALGALKKYESSLEAVRSNQEAFNYTKQKFEVGLVNAVEYSIAQNDLTKAKSDLLTARYEYIFKNKILDFYAGNNIVL